MQRTFVIACLFASVRTSALGSAPVPPTVIRSMRSVGWPTPTGTPWPFLPQVPMPVSSLRSLPIMRDAVQVGRPVADQHRALDRRADLAVLDAVGLGALEHVFARGDVDLAAAEIHRIDAVLHRLARISPGSRSPASM